MSANPTSVTRAFRDLVSRVWPLAENERWRLGLAVLFVILSSGLNLLYPWVMRIIIDDGIKAQDLQLINQLAFLMVAILLVDFPASYFRVYFFDTAARRMSFKLAARAQRNILRQDIAFFDAESSAELNSRAVGDANQISQLLTLGVQDGARFGLIGFFALGLMFYSAPLLSVIVIGVAPVLAIVTSVLGRMLQVRQAKEQKTAAEMGAGSYESLAAIRTLRAFDREDVEHQHMKENLSKLTAVGDSRTRATAVLEAVTNFGSEAAIVTGIWAGGMMIVSGRLTEGALVSFIMYAGLVVRSFKNITAVSGEMMRAHGATQRVFQLLDREPRIPEGKMLRPDQAVGNIRLAGVDFSYPSRPTIPILRHLDLEIPAGQFLAVVGPSGMGKSTIGNLIVRFYDPDAGHIYFDDHDIRDLDPSWLREHVTLVQQDPALFSRTIEENAKFGSEDAPSDDVVAALDAVGADEFIRRQPAGMNTMLGDRGVTFSGGQRQRLAIARALLRKPRVLILDEATSALDSETESFVKESLRKLWYRPTVMIVAHRLSTVVDADRVILVQDGKIAASGTHPELLAHSEAYRELVESQLVQPE